MRQTGHLNFSWIIEGKLAGHAVPSSEKDLRWLKQQGILGLVRMAEKHKTVITSSQVEKLGMKDCYEPVPDFAAPTLAQIDRMVHFISESLVEGRPVGVSCGSGLGRTGTVLACFLVSQGLTPDDAVSRVRKSRPGSIETRDQEKAVHLFGGQVNATH